MLAPLVVSAGSVAEGETAAIPAAASSGPTASTSWLPEGPTTASALDAMIALVLVGASAGFSPVSLWPSVKLVPLALLNIATASSAK